MGYKDISEAELKNISSLNLFFQAEKEGSSMHIINEVYGLLVQFRDNPDCFDQISSYQLS